MTNDEFRRYIREKRIERGLSLMKLGKMAGITYTNINRMEMGHTKMGPTIETAARLLDAMDCDLVIVDRRK